MNARATPYSGFTLIELVVVMVIMSIVMAVSGPYLGNFYRSVKADASLRQLRIFLSNARHVALAEKKTCVVVAEKGWRQMALYLREKQPDTDETHLVRLDGGAASYKLLPGMHLSAIRINGSAVPVESETRIDIHPLAVPNETAFVLQDQDGGVSSVKMTAGGGRVLIEKKDL